LSVLKITDSSGIEVCSFTANESSIEALNNDSSLVGWWKLDDENSVIHDYSGNGNDGLLYGNTRLLLDFDDGTATDKTAYSNNGTLMNGVDCSADGISGQGCSFDGVDDYIEVAYSNSLRLNDSTFSISLWFNAESGDQFPRILSSESDNINLYLTNNFNGSHLVRFYIISNITGERTYSDGQIPEGLIAYDDFDWHNVVIQYDGNLLQLFVDGFLLNENQLDNGIYDFNDVKLYLGRRNSGNFFNGSIDEVAIYSKALTEEEVKELYESQKAKFIEFKDSKIDKAVEFDGVDDYVEVPNSTSFNNLNELTLLAFINNHNVPNMEKDEGIIGKGWENGSINSSFNLQIDHTVVGPHFNYGYHYVNLTNYDHKINFIVGWYNNSLQKLYLNNSFMYNENDSLIGLKNSNDNLTLGVAGRTAAADFFNGQIDEVRIYNRTLTENEIKQLYWYSIKPQQNGVNQIDISSCNLTKGNTYNILAVTDNQVVSSTQIKK
jgi:hypothetical protein